ncbi:hypothetical protein RDMS_02860 [Deinococcus sp. RL]|nr:hypothetical protein RDMS_02860 [Deinococcus sp. RL]
MRAFSSAQWLRVRLALEGQAEEDRLTSAQRVLNSPETDLEVAQCPLPVGIDDTSIPTLHKLNPFGHEQQGRHGKHQDQPFQAGRVS